MEFQLKTPLTADQGPTRIGQSLETPCFSLRLPCTFYRDLIVEVNRFDELIRVDLVRFDPTFTSPLPTFPFPFCSLLL